MTTKTHITTGVALTILITQPENIKYLTLSLAGTIIGSVIPDIDSKNSEANQIFDKVLITTSLTIILCFILEYFFNIGIYRIITKKNNIDSILFSALLFFIMCLIGSRTHHRAFTHSIIGLLIYSSILYTLPNIFIYSFIIGYLSHIILDLFNHKGLKLFYPIKKRLCFNLCDSDGIINNILFYLSSIASLIILIIYCT
ncbi:MAG: metal-dependent hydrolase [Bacilli bacterium]|nr:metal-dependent hydrolase [Bacilli bacterium]